MTRPVRILVVDDSLLYRMTIRKALVALSGVEFVGSAPNGRTALEMIEEHDPDLLTLDVQMPDIDGIEVLRSIRDRGHGAKAIMLSGLTSTGAQATTDSLMEGAFDFILKPSGPDADKNLQDLRSALSEKIDAFRSSIGGESSPTPASSSIAFRLPSGFECGLVVIGTSTGGPEALRSLMPGIQKGFSFPILVVQHMPPGYTDALANRLNGLCSFPVAEARDGMRIQPGTAVIAPGGRQMKLIGSGARARVRITDDPADRGCRPSVDYLLHSVAGHFGRSTAVAILTGMGRDGTEGCRAIKSQGGVVIAQDSGTSAVFGMPASVIKQDLVNAVLPLDQIPAAINRLL